MSTKKSSKSKLVDKSETADYVDLLDEDKPMSGQKYVCLSFISPEDHIKNKNLFYFEKFLTNFEFKKTFEKYTQFLNFLSYK
jgi:ribosome biogenesis protein Nip4